MVQRQVGAGRLVAMVRSHSSGWISSIGAQTPLMPALANHDVEAPNRLLRSPTARSIACASATSAINATALPPSALDLVHGFADLILRVTERAHDGALAGQQNGGGLADPGAGPGDQRHLAVQFRRTLLHGQASRVLHTVLRCRTVAGQPGTSIHPPTGSPPVVSGNGNDQRIAGRKTRFCNADPDGLLCERNHRAA